MDRAFSPQTSLCMSSWGGAPGWDGVAPLARSATRPPCAFSAHGCRSPRSRWDCRTANREAEKIQSQTGVGAALVLAERSAARFVPPRGNAQERTPVPNRKRHLHRPCADASRCASASARPGGTSCGQRPPLHHAPLRRMAAGALGRAGIAGREPRSGRNPVADWRSQVRAALGGHGCTLSGHSARLSPEPTGKSWRPPRPAPYLAANRGR